MPARLGLTFAGCPFMFMSIVRLISICPYWRTMVSLFCVIRLTGPSNVQSKRMLVVSHRNRGLSRA